MPEDQRGSIEGIVMSSDTNQHIYIALGREEPHLSRQGIVTSFQEAREALQWSEHQYRILFETMPQGVLYQDARGYIIDANLAAQHLLGLSLDQLQGRTLFDAHWSAIREDGSPFPGDAHPITVALRTGQAVTNVVMGILISEEEQYRWITVNAVPRFYPGESTPYQVYAIFNDMTEQKRLQDALQASERKARERAVQLEAIFEAILDTVFVYNKEGAIVHVNSPGCEFLALETQPDFAALSLPERFSRLMVRNEYGQFLSEEQWIVHRLLHGEVIKGANALDFIIRTLDGRDVQCSVSGAPIHDQDGQVIGAVAVSRDVTARRGMELWTRNALDSLLAVAEVLVQDSSLHSATDTPAESVIGPRLAEWPCRLPGCQQVCIARLDSETESLYPLVVVGASPEQEHSWRDNLQGTRLSSVLGSAQLATRLREGELLFLDSDQPLLRDLPAYTVIAPILSANQLIGILMLGYSGVKPSHTAADLSLIQTIARLASLVIERERAHNERDTALTALQEANERLGCMNKVKSEFVSMVSHEFRTALTTIQGFSEVMRDDEFSMMEMKEFAADIYADTRRLTRLINDLLDLDRMEAGRMQLRLGWLDLHGIIMDVVSRFRPLLQHHTLRMQLASALPIMMGDRDKLTQVVSNLLHNAIKYSPAGGEVYISSSVEGNRVHVCVRDSGVGIPAQAIDRIFERYERVASETAYASEGTGLGLPTVRQIVQMHGGQVWAESIPGEGSLFHFTVQFTSGSSSQEGE